MAKSPSLAVLDACRNYQFYGVFLPNISTSRYISTSISSQYFIAPLVNRPRVSSNSCCISACQAHRKCLSTYSRCIEVHVSRHLKNCNRVCPSCRADGGSILRPVFLRTPLNSGIASCWYLVATAVQCSASFLPVLVAICN